MLVRVSPRLLRARIVNDMVVLPGYRPAVTQRVNGEDAEFATGQYVNEVLETGTT
jgi:hypothetical protein